MTPLPRVRYGVGGGAPPASAELLTVEPSGATYLTGHPWPMQPPFDEIGTYAAPVGDDAGELAALLDGLRGRGAELRSAPGFADAGLESLTVAWQDEELDLVWSPPRRPAPLEPVVVALRELITRLREHPVSVLRATRAHTGLQLENRGTEAIALDRAAELWVGDGDPTELAVGEPTAVDIPETVLESGAMVTAAPLPDAPAALLHVAWTARGEGAIAQPQPGWLLLR